MRKFVGKESREAWWEEVGVGSSSKALLSRGTIATSEKKVQSLDRERVKS